MTKRQLINKAEYKGNMRMWQTNPYYATYRHQPNGFTLFNEITHYFNAEMQELGFVAFENTEFETVHIFDPPRIWGEEASENLELVAL